MRVIRSGSKEIVRLDQKDKVSGHRPSVDVLFESVAESYKDKALGIILTGMGKDGAEGLKKMKDADAYTIGQDQDSCIVYGMPQEAFKIGGVGKQLPLDKIMHHSIKYFIVK